MKTILLTTLATLSALIYSSCEIDNTSSQITKKVTFKITGKAKYTRIDYKWVNDQGEDYGLTSHSAVSAGNDWQAEIDAKIGKSISCSASNVYWANNPPYADSAFDITLHVIIDGKEIDSRSAKGSYGASLSYSGTVN